MEKLDSFDYRILELMKVNAKRTGEQLSEEIGLSPTACRRRVQRLRKIGAIEREVAIISPKVEKRGLVIIVLMTIDGHSPRIMDEFCQRLRGQPVVNRLVWVTGEDDIVLVLHCASMEEFDEFARAYINDAPVVGYKTLVSMREYQTWDVSNEN